MPTETNKTATAKTASKPRAVKPAVTKPVAVTPVPAPAAAKPDTSGERTLQRDVAGLAVAAYYDKPSRPFKSVHDTFRPLAANTKASTLRQAALLAVMLAADTADNIKPNGTFVRGGFRVPAKLVFNPAELTKRAIDPNAVIACQPESGCLSDMHGRVLSYVSGPTTGKQQREAVYKLDLKAVRAELSAMLGDKLGAAALARLDKLGVKAA